MIHNKEVGNQCLAPLPVFVIFEEDTADLVWIGNPSHESVPTELQFIGFSCIEVGLESDSSHKLFVSIKYNTELWWYMDRYRAYKYYADEIGSKLGYCYPFCVYSFCNHCILSQMITRQSLGQPTHAYVAWTTKVVTAQKDQGFARIYTSIKKCLKSRWFYLSSRNILRAGEKRMTFVIYDLLVGTRK